MTEQLGDDIEWPTGEDEVNTAHDNPMTAYPTEKAHTYPEYPDNPHNHRFTMSFTGAGAPMVVVRGNTATECNAALNELEAYGVWANIGAAHAALKAQGTLGAGVGPVTPVAAPQPPPAPPVGAVQGPPFGPNVSVPQAPAYVGPPTPVQQQQWAPPPQQQAARQGPKPQPAGWWKIDVPWARKDEFKTFRETNQETFKGRCQWGGGGVYWIDQGLGQWLAQSGWAVSQ